MKNKVIAIVVGIVVVVSLLLSREVIENVSAGYICVIQSPVSGTLDVYTTPGLKWQWFGNVTYYKMESQYWFSALKDQGEATDQSIKVRFNDGGHGMLSGSARWTMPLDVESIRYIHTKFGSQTAIEQQLIRTTIEKAVYMTGPLMSSKESSSTKRNDLISFVTDQTLLGIYKTLSKEVIVKDEFSGKDKQVTVVEPIKDPKNGNYLRQEKSSLARYKVNIYNLSINSLNYDENVEAQIQAQQKIAMDIQTSIADAKKAEQNAIKAEQEGIAKSATAKWEQEVIKAKVVTEAQQKKEVAKLNMEAADFYKKEQILRGEGDGAYQKLLMQANGNLDTKIEAYKEVNKIWAEAIGGYKGNWVPTNTFVMGGGSGAANNNNAATAFMELMTAKAAKDLSLDLTVPAK
jgi:hypothetical protein